MFIYNAKVLTRTKENVFSEDLLPQATEQSSRQDKKGLRKVNLLLVLFLTFFLVTPILIFFQIGAKTYHGVYYQQHLYGYSFVFWVLYFLSYFDKTKKVAPTLGKFLGAVTVSFLLIFSVPKLFALLGFIGFLIVAYVLFLGVYFLYKKIIVPRVSS